MMEHHDFGKRAVINTENSIMRRMMIKRFMLSNTVESNKIPIDEEMETEFDNLCDAFGCVGPEKDRLKDKLQPMLRR